MASNDEFTATDPISLIATVHGRNTMRHPVEWAAEDGETLHDLSEQDIYFEIDGVSVRKKLTIDPDDNTRLWLILTPTEHAALRLHRPYKCSLIVDTNPEWPDVKMSGTITVFGYRGLPDEVEDSE